MNAAVLTGYGDIKMLELRELPDPKPAHNEIKVRMVGAGINPHDWKVRSGSRRPVLPLDFPVVLGQDVSGVVVEVGAGITRFKVGARVMGMVKGAYAELVVAASDAWVEVPAAMDLVAAAALPLVLLTGAQLIEEAIRPNRGDVLLIAGAVGSVGRVAVFVAQAHGVRVWAGVRASQKADATALGADHVVVLDDARAMADLPTLDALADTVGGATTSVLARKIKRGGILGTVVGEADRVAQPGVMVRSVSTHTDPARLALLARAVAEGRLRIPIAKLLPLSQVRRAQTLAEQSHGRGKIILTGGPEILLTSCAA